MKSDCGTDEQCRNQVLPTCLTTHYFQDFEEQQTLACAEDRPIVPIQRDVDVVLFRGKRIGEGEVVQHSRALQRFYAPHELWFSASEFPQTDEIVYAMQGSEEDFVKALLDADIDLESESEPDAEEEALIQEIVGRIMFKSMRQFLDQHAKPPQVLVNIAVIQRIVSPELAKFLDLGDSVIVGLGVSPTLFDRVFEDDDSLNTLLDIEEDFTPSLFVGHRDIAEFPGAVEIVIAHEMGHALGLPHVEDEGNLMEQGGRLDCRPWLTQDQVDSMGPFALVADRGGQCMRWLSLPQRAAEKLRATVSSATDPSR